MNQIEKARYFHTLHDGPDPLILYNIWDVATAKAVENSGASAIATGSWSVAAAQGFEDGQNLPFAQLIHLAERLVSNTALPVSIDFECGYAESLGQLEDRFSELLDTGIVGINFEDQTLGQSALVPIEEQAQRLSILSDVAKRSGIPVFINARTDLFLQQSDESKQAMLIDEALRRAVAYAEAGASGLFIPGLSCPDLISEICNRTDLPVNVMTAELLMDVSSFTELGVKRISFGPSPFQNLMRHFAETARQIYG